MRKLFLLLIVSQLAACAHTDQTWVRDYDGNQLDIKLGHKGDDGVNKFISITNTNREWAGQYKGGEEMLPARKRMLLDIGQGQAAEMCKPANYLADGTPDYTMLDRSPALFGGGLIGYALAAGMSDYANLPTAMYFKFTCTNNPVAPTKDNVMNNAAPYSPIVAPPTTPALATPPQPGEIAPAVPTPAAPITSDIK